MEEYILTQEDIDILNANDFDTMGAVVGGEALASEAEFLRNRPVTPAPLTGGAARRARRGQNTPQVTSATVQPPAAEPTAEPLTLEVTSPTVLEEPTPAATPSPAPAQGMDRSQILAALMSSQAAPAAPTDPFESLSKTQRRMLAFAGLSDAGAALQGMKGGSVSALMGRFNEMQDMERKRQAAAQQNAVMMSVFGGQDGAPAMVIDSPEAARARIAQLTQLAIANPSLVAGFQTEIARLSAEAERMEAESVEAAQKSTINVGKINQAKDALSAARRALKASLGLDGKDLDAALESGSLDPSSFVFARQGWTPDGQRFKDFDAATKELGAMMTFQNMAEVIASGAKLGILSNSDIELLGSLSGVIDVRNAPVQTAQTVFRLYNKLNQTINALEAEQGNSLLNKYGLEG